MKCNITATPFEIEQTWKALTRSKVFSHPMSERRARDIAEAGWVSPHEIEDALSMLDHRLDHTWLSSMPHILERLSLKKEFNYSRQWKYVDEIWGGSSLSSSDALRYFWWLERIGFPIDLGKLGDEIANTLPRTRSLSRSHLDVLLYCSERYTQTPIILLVEHGEHLNVDYAEKFTSENGVTVEISYNNDGKPISLVSTAPAYSPPKEEVGVDCEVCGLTYIQGIKGNEDQHAKHHRKIMEPLAPRPSRAWRSAVHEDSEAVWVDGNSPVWMHVAMYRRAKAFKREFGYDFIPWSEYPDCNKGGVAYAFLDQDFRMVGGCRFQLDGGVNGCNRLSWIWICPDARRQGYLSKAWARLQEKMGDFDLEPPISDAMQAFMLAMSA